MLKVSFKDKKGCPAKKVQVFNNKTTKVTLVGKIKFPDWWMYIPLDSDIMRWVNNHPSVEFHYGLVVTDSTIIVDGISTCSDEDEFNPVFGERIAEARAKKRLYSFMVTLINKTIKHYRKILYGNCQINVFETVTYDSKPVIPNLFTDLMKYEELYSSECDHLNNLLAMS